MRGRNSDRRMNSSDGSIYYRNNKNRRNNVSEKGRCEDRLPNTLTHSLTLSHFSSLNTNHHLVDLQIDIVSHLFIKSTNSLGITCISSQ